MCGDDSHVNRKRLAPADPHDDALLEHTQEFGLRIEREGANLVEGKRAAGRPPGTALCRRNQGTSNQTRSLMSRLDPPLTTRSFIAAWVSTQS